MLIQTLYGHIQQKDKILTSERVVTVKNHPSHVSVITERGNTYTGTFVVGGDGIHSTVRQQMWDEAEKTDPTWFDKSEANGRV
jgi:2-polyprenyl-6-methoxyphenol hydroxylase-like FAD-dependent oxidoreductase